MHTLAIKTKERQRLSFVFMIRHSSSPWLRSNCKLAYPVRRSPSSLGRRSTWVSRSVATLPCHLEQKSRTIPRGYTPEIRTRAPSFLVASPQASALVELATRIGVRILRARRWELAHVSREQKYSPKTKLPLS